MNKISPYILDDIEFHKNGNPSREAKDFFWDNREDIFTLVRIAIRIGQARKAESRSEIEAWTNVAAEIIED